MSYTIIKSIKFFVKDEVECEKSIREIREHRGRLSRSERLAPICLGSTRNAPFKEIELVES